MTAAWFAASALLVTPEAVAGRLGAYLAESRGDRDARMTRNVLRLELGGAAREPRVLLVGASDFQEALSKPGELARAAGTPVHTLFSDWQSLVDSAAIVERLPPFDGALVLMVSPILLARGAVYEPSTPNQAPFHRRYGFRADVRDEIARGAGRYPRPRTGNLFLDNYEFYLSRAPYVFRNALLGPPGYAWHISQEGKPPHAEEKRLFIAERLKRVVSRYETELAESKELLARICAEAKVRGDVKMVLLESPLSRRGQREIVGLERYREHREHMRAFATKHGVEYWSFEEGLVRTDADYIDDQHLLTDASRREFTSLMCERLHALLNGSEGAP